MKLRLVALSVITCGIALASSAFAVGQSPDDYVKTQHARLETLLRQPESPARGAQVSASLDGMIDYEALTRRTFGEPCPVDGCVDHWAKDLSPEQRTEALGLIKTLVQLSYKKNLSRTLSYNIAYSGSQALGADFVVHTEAKSKVDLREPSVLVDYVLAGSSGGPYHVIDIVTERSKLTKNYYDSFHKYLTTPGQGFGYLKTKVQDKITKLQAPAAG